MIGKTSVRLGKLASSLAFVFLVLALALAISWPLWSFATGDRRAFTLSVGAAAALGILVLALRGLRSRVRSRSGASRGASGPRRSA